MKSKTLTAYRAWVEQATPAEIELVDSIYAECEKHWAQGGDVVVECFSPRDILTVFGSVNDAREYCQLKAEQATNCRWGDDDDPEIESLRRAAEWGKD